MLLLLLLHISALATPRLTECQPLASQATRKHWRRAPVHGAFNVDLYAYNRPIAKQTEQQVEHTELHMDQLLQQLADSSRRSAPRLENGLSEAQLNRYLDKQLAKLQSQSLWRSNAGVDVRAIDSGETNNYTTLNYLAGGKETTLATAMEAIAVPPTDPPAATVRKQLTTAAAEQDLRVVHTTTAATTAAPAAAAEATTAAAGAAVAEVAATLAVATTAAAEAAAMDDGDVAAMLINKQLTPLQMNPILENEHAHVTANLYSQEFHVQHMGEKKFVKLNTLQQATPTPAPTPMATATVGHKISIAEVMAEQLEEPLKLTLPLPEMDKTTTAAAITTEIATNEQVEKLLPIVKNVIAMTQQQSNNNNNDSNIDSGLLSSTTLEMPPPAEQLTMSMLKQQLIEAMHASVNDIEPDSADVKPRPQQIEMEMDIRSEVEQPTTVNFFSADNNSATEATEADIDPRASQKNVLSTAELMKKPVLALDETDKAEPEQADRLTATSEDDESKATQPTNEKKLLEFFERRAEELPAGQAQDVTGNKPETNVIGSASYEAAKIQAASPLLDTDDIDVDASDSVNGQAHHVPGQLQMADESVSGHAAADKTSLFTSNLKLKSKSKRKPTKTRNEIDTKLTAPPSIPTKTVKTEFVAGAALPEIAAVDRRRSSSTRRPVVGPNGVSKGDGENKAGNKGGKGKRKGTQRRPVNAEQEMESTNWWHILPYTEIRKFLNTIYESISYEDE